MTLEIETLHFREWTPEMVKNQIERMGKCRDKDVLPCFPSNQRSKNEFIEKAVANIWKALLPFYRNTLQLLEHDRNIHSMRARALTKDTDEDRTTFFEYEIKTPQTEQDSRSDKKVFIVDGRLPPKPVRKRTGRKD